MTKPCRRAGLAVAFGPRLMAVVGAILLRSGDPTVGARKALSAGPSDESDVVCARRSASWNVPTTRVGRRRHTRADHHALMIRTEEAG